MQIERIRLMYPITPIAIKPAAIYVEGVGTGMIYATHQIMRIMIEPSNGCQMNTRTLANSTMIITMEMVDFGRRRHMTSRSIRDAHGAVIRDSVRVLGDLNRWESVVDASCECESKKIILSSLSNRFSS